MVKTSMFVTAKQVAKNIENGTFKFDNVIQRALVWDKRRKSDLIHSLVEDFPVPGFYAKKITKTDEDGKTRTVFDFLDGKQRTNAISGYISGDYSLLGIKKVHYEDGLIDINGKYFDELPEELREKILDYSFFMYCFEDITDEEVVTMYLKLNNGKQLSPRDRNTANCKDIIRVTEIGKHELFSYILTPSAINNRKQIPLVLKTWVMLFDKANAAFTSSIFNNVMATVVISHEEEAVINSVYDKAVSIFENISNFYEKSVYTKVKKKMSAETHLISIIPYIKEAIDKGIYDDDLADFFVEMFTGTQNEDGTITIISDEYRLASTNGSARASQIQIRDAEIRKVWDKWLRDKINK